MAWGSRIHRNSVFSFLSYAVRMGANVLVFIGIARLYGAEAFGQFGSAQTVLIVFSLLADFGLDLFIATKIAGEPGKTEENIRRYLPLKVVLGFAAMFAMFCFALVVDASEPTRVIMSVLSLSILANTVMTFFIGVMKGREEMQHETAAMFWLSLFLIVAVVILGILHVPVVVLALAYVGSRFVGLGVMARRVRRVAKLDVLPLRGIEWRSTMREVLPFGLQLVFGTLYLQLDTLLLMSWAGDRTVGIYQAAIRLVMIVLMIPDVLVNAILPPLARLFHEDEDRWRSGGKLMVKTMAFISLPFAILFAAYGEEIISGVYGAEGYREAVPILAVFSVTLVVRFLAEPFAVMLTTSHRHSVRTVIVTIATALVFAGNAYMIPHYGSIGAAVVAAAVNILTCLAYIVSGRSRFGVRFALDGRMLGAGALAVVSGLFLFRFSAPFFSVGLPFVLVGVPILLFLLGYTPGERSVLMRAVQSSRSPQLP